MGINSSEFEADFSREGITDTLKNLEGPMRLIREQAMLSNPPFDTFYQDRYEITVGQTFTKYSEYLTGNKDRVVEEFFSGKQDKFDSFLKVLGDTPLRKVLLAYYAARPEEKWKDAVGKIVSWQGYKDDNWPQKQVVDYVFTELHQ